MGSVRKTLNTIRLFTCYCISQPICCCAGRSRNPTVACLSFPCGAPVIQGSLQSERKWVWGLCSWQRLRSSSGSKLAEQQEVSFFSQVYKHFLNKKKKNCYFFCFSAVHLDDLNRCSPCASHYRQHPPIICSTNLPPPPSPLLASPPIPSLDRPSAARMCVNAAYEDTSHRA